MKSPVEKIKVLNGEIYLGDICDALEKLEENKYQAIIADPPYFQVLVNESWDNQWKTEDDYLQWTSNWIDRCIKVLADDGLLYVFGQLGKREHIWIHICSMITKKMQFHDMIIWDRAVGYNDRHDSFTPQYEMVLVLRKRGCENAYFDKDAVRIAYDEATIKMYLKDKRYKDRDAREKHLKSGKYATNILRIPSLKGASKEKVGHPSQKPVALIEALVKSSSRVGDFVLDPFLGSGTTALVCENTHRRWHGIEIEKRYVEICKRRLSEKSISSTPPPAPPPPDNGDDLI